MTDYEWVENLEIKSFSNVALVQLSRFARVLKKVNGHVLSLRDPELPRNLVREVRETGDPRLRSLFESLLPEFYVIAKRSSVPVKGNTDSFVVANRH
jgi:hypothetical protein